MSFWTIVRDGRSLLFLAVSLSFFLLYEPVGLLMQSEYDREAIINGEYWRIVSAHFTHTQMMHLLLNWAAWLMVWIYGWAVCGTVVWIVLLLLCSVGTSLGLLAFSADLQFYTGFSGVLHGLLVALAIFRLLLYKNDASAWIVLAFIAVKLIYEAVYGPTPTTQSLIEMRIIVESHLYGTVSGIIIALPLGYFLRGRYKKEVLDPPAKLNIRRAD